MSLGWEAPQVSITRSKSFFNCSAFMSTPTLTPVLKMIPSASIIFMRRSITSFSSFIFGIPYIKRPPGWSSLSNTVTWWPLRFSWSAAARPEGPDPTMATVFPVRTFGGFGSIRPCEKPYSIMAFSFSLMVTGVSFNPHVHAASQGAGQTLEVNSGKLLVLSSRPRACS